MELREFVAETIKEVIDGVLSAQEYAKGKGSHVNPPINFRTDQGMAMWDRNTAQPIQSISFDVAVTAAEGTKTQGGIAVFAGAFGLGSKGQSDKSNETINRIQFSVPIALPISE
ncbi:MAG: hypothetical protein QOE34_876 [Verrucomicrobiota bacterium]|jgi:hypothetical protein